MRIFFVHGYAISLMDLRVFSALESDEIKRDTGGGGSGA